jgi:hypothetical protein
MAKYGVYIIESLRELDYTDGKTLHGILKLSRIPSTYSWVNSIEKFKSSLKDFQKSKFRYLHISCHANETGIEINGDFILNADFQNLTKEMLVNKRLFLSACKGANRDLASRIVLKNNAYSLIGMPIKLRFDKSVLFWPSFYHLINEIDSNKMRRKDIIEIVKKCVDLFNVPVNYYSRITYNTNYIRRLKIRINGFLDNRIIKSTI